MIFILVRTHLFLLLLLDTFADDDCYSVLITGPNSGGKSTLMRAVAIACIMAQIGAHVCAQSCVLSAVDAIFTRVGATDNMCEGLSTFAVEASEAAFILNNATSKSLVVCDEVGRGTST